MNLLVCAFLLCVSLAYAAEDKFYKVKYKVNLEEVLKSDRLLENYYACLTDKGSCTGAGLELKRIIPDAVATKCRRCSPAQKEAAIKAVKFLSKERPDMWRALEDKFDPEGKFRELARKDPDIRKLNIDI